MATTDQVVFLKSLQNYEEGLNSLVKHYNEISADSTSGEISQVSSEIAAHIYSLIRRDVKNMISAYRKVMGV